MVIDRQARLVEVESWGDYFLFTLDSPEIASQARPGQFLMIRVSETTQPLLRRPISLHNAEGNRLQIFFQVAGEGTRLLSLKKTGQFLDLLGPLGKGFNVRPEFREREIFCVGGGRGIAPLYYLGRELRAAGAQPVIFYGGRSEGDLPLRYRLETAGFEVLVSTDDGSAGFPGFVTSLVEEELKKRRPAFLYACGPDPMMEKLAETCRREKLPAEFSLESIMGCGFGACWGCVKKIRRDGQEKYLKVCQDGPVFSLEEIVWQEREHG
ncbi:MAG: dihydroorotate dehydrogenase electron transfer subunit [Candidatus Aminicenantes bacterium]|nr:dihydroorotate dehydrogenase electron transfer subunit [Candidatus Aminicenantes bacterium]